MTRDRHDNLVESQFSAQAAAYVTSAVHAEGDDLRELADLARGRPDARVLDLGCGGGHVSFRLAPLVREVVAYDLSPAMLSVVKAEADRRGLSNIVTCEGPVERLPFEAGSFDLVLSRYSAHHWSDFRAGLREARRVLNAEGRAGFEPGEVTRRRVRLEFQSWVTRIGTPEAHVKAIRSLQTRMAAEVVNHYAIEPDGTFMLDTMTLEAKPA
jgi:ubiquinone/menaquinone biosynthesis C-methylase UbiE